MDQEEYIQWLRRRAPTSPSCNDINCTDIEDSPESPDGYLSGTSDDDPHVVHFRNLTPAEEVQQEARWHGDTYDSDDIISLPSTENEVIYISDDEGLPDEEPHVMPFAISNVRTISQGTFLFGDDPPHHQCSTFG